MFGIVRGRVSTGIQNVWQGHNLRSLTKRDTNILSNISVISSVQITCLSNYPICAQAYSTPALLILILKYNLIHI